MITPIELSNLEALPGTRGFDSLPLPCVISHKLSRKTLRFGVYGSSRKAKSLKLSLANSRSLTCVVFFQIIQIAQCFGRLQMSEPRNYNFAVSSKKVSHEIESC